MYYKRLAITEFKLEIPKCPGKQALKAALEEADILAKFDKTTWGKKLLARKTKASLTDFGRFKAMIAKKAKSAKVKAALK